MRLFHIICTSILILVSIPKTELMAQANAKIIYIGDPMCSWCYGFEPELTTVKDTFNELEFELILGGLRPYSKEKMSDLSEFLRHHWEEIAEKTGQKFSYELLEQDDFVYDTEPASRAVVCAQQQNEEVTMPFYKAVQEAFYRDNKSTHDINTYLTIAKTFDLDTDLFEFSYSEDETLKATRDNFLKAQEMGVRGFPTLMLEKDGELHLISNGYQSADVIIKKIRKIIE